MRRKVYSVFAGSLLGIFICLVVLFPPYKQKSIFFISQISNSIASFLPEKQINFELEIPDLNNELTPNGGVPPEALKHLPFEDSGLMWFLRKTRIEESLQQDPTLLSAKIKSCGVIPFQCFTVYLEERTPAGFVVDPQNIIYLVGSDGGFIRKARKEDSSLSLPTFVITRNDTSDIIRKKIQLLSRVAVKVKETLLVMPSVVALKSSDIEISWKKLPLKAILSSVSMYEEDRLEKELNRVSLVLRMYKGRENQIQKIDATPLRLAVVSEIESLTPPQASSKS